jgi:hypothetical protein
MNFASFCYFLKLKKAAGTFWYRGRFDPGPLTRGARGTTLEARLAWSTGQRPARLAPRHLRRPAMAAATTWKKEGERGRPDRELTGNAPVVLAWPEDGRRQQIWPAKSSVSGEESATVAVTPATTAQFVSRAGRERHRRPSQHVGGAGGSTGRRRYTSSLDYWEVSRERGRGPTGKKRRAARERKKGRGRHGVQVVLQRGSPRR